MDSHFSLFNTILDVELVRLSTRGSKKVKKRGREKSGKGFGGSWKRHTGFRLWPDSRIVPDPSL